jgi:hypothetical protein
MIDQPLHRLLAILPPLALPNLIPLIRNPLKRMSSIVHHPDLMLNASLFELLGVRVRLGRRDELIGRGDDEERRGVGRVVG